MKIASRSAIYFTSSISLDCLMLVMPWICRYNTAHRKFGNSATLPDHSAPGLWGLGQRPCFGAAVGRRLERPTHQSATFAFGRLLANTSALGFSAG